MFDNMVMAYKDLCNQRLQPSLRVNTPAMAAASPGGVKALSVAAAWML